MVGRLLHGFGEYQSFKMRETLQSFLVKGLRSLLMVVLDLEGGDFLSLDGVDFFLSFNSFS